MPMGQGRNMIMPINNSMCVFLCLCAFMCAYVCVSDMMCCLIGQVPNFVLNLPGDYNTRWHRPSLLGAGVLDALD